MASDANGIPELDQDKYDADEQVKIICLGDSAVGKSKYGVREHASYLLSLQIHLKDDSAYFLWPRRF